MEWEVNGWASPLLPGFTLTSAGTFANTPPPPLSLNSPWKLRVELIKLGLDRSPPPLHSPLGVGDTVTCAHDLLLYLRPGRWRTLVGCSADSNLQRICWVVLAAFSVFSQVLPLRLWAAAGCLDKDPHRQIWRSNSHFLFVSPAKTLFVCVPFRGF
jgi:hypothetical protein